MTKVRFLCCLLSVLAVTVFADKPLVDIIPYPQNITMADGQLPLTAKTKICCASDELLSLGEVLSGELYQVTSLKLEVSRVPPKAGDIVLRFAPNLKDEQHEVIINSKAVCLGGNYKAVAMAATSLVQAVEKGASLPKFSAFFEPHSSYRSLMVDIARQGHTLDTLYQCVVMCRMYKANYLQLHLTDDQSFTFQSKAFPKLSTPGRSFSMEELKKLVAYADARGVTIIPEFDAPAHTSAMRKAMPELFGRNGLSVINLGKEEVHDAMKTIAAEMMEVFASSPYFHIGADEAWFAQLAKDPAAQQRIKEKGYDNVHDLFLEYIVDMNAFIKSKGKKTVMWESFRGKGSSKVTIPNDILIMAWETMYQLPQSLLDNDYTILNVSWKPTYLTPGRRWNPDYIYKWNMFRWENHWSAAPSYHPIQLEAYPNDRIIGGMMCSWESRDEMQIPGIRLRLAPLMERFWMPHSKLPYAHFAARFKHSDRILQSLIRPVAFEVSGLADPDYIGPFYNRENWFGNKATVSLEPMIADTVIRYTLDGSVPTATSQIYKKPFTLTANTTVRTQVFNKRGRKIGFIATRPYEHRPITGIVDGLLMTVPHDDVGRGMYRTKFGEKVTVTLSSNMEGGKIRYTTNGRKPGPDDAVYTQPLELTASGTACAMYFGKDGKACGTMWRRQFEHIDAQNNLTTGKPVTASYYDARAVPENAVDGIVDRNFHWNADARDGKPAWWQVDLQDSQVLNKIQVITYWDGSRYYQYEVEVSLDGKNWTQVADMMENRKPATKEGFFHEFNPVISRYIKVTMYHNSANPGLHLTEVRAFTD